MTGEAFTDGAHTNWAESYFALLRKMECGIHHQIGAQQLETYANELARRQGNCELKESEKIKFLPTRCLNMPPSLADLFSPSGWDTVTPYFREFSGTVAAAIAGRTHNPLPLYAGAG
jgi:hypothetical protein